MILLLSHHSNCIRQSKIILQKPTYDTKRSSQAKSHPKGQDQNKTEHHKHKKAHAVRCVNPSMVEIICVSCWQLNLTLLMPHKCLKDAPLQITTITATTLFKSTKLLDNKIFIFRCHLERINRHPADDSQCLLPSGKCLHWRASCAPLGPKWSPRASDTRCRSPPWPAALRISASAPPSVLRLPPHKE